ncbi:hypothetical protein B0G62_119115 [Paraburkholderia eburnea]|uniref:Uncharacterized protein n=1 Tax=Paraburkholderia eburnea TaxID=1189126 RepID=A0A2S4LXY1_9BURK|nr:hypothetical protein [Paraburkholderia eburnea]POR47307.1 hypothetical protein B0G62_119115 [Paraburkholderia eburnea]PRZ18684.1 hypothetical protein BX588_119115 [Paraburkholderia eburnea]
MWFVGIGLILNLVACIANFSHLLHFVGNEQAANFFATFLVLWAFLIIGFIMQLARKVRMGALLLTLGSLVFMVGSAVLLPFGLLVAVSFVAGIVTIIGALKVMRRREA